MVNTSVFKALPELKNLGLVDSAFLNIKKWLEDDNYKEYWAEIKALIADKNVNELNNAFYKVIPFGTGGRRGKMGAGTNRINSRAIAESAQGFAQYLFTVFGEKAARERGVVITYDVRHHSLDFARVAAEVFVANGLKVYFFDGIRSTPQLSFTIRYKKAIGGVMISASHNPPSDNGIKIYWEYGGQVVPPHDLNIIKEVNSIRDVKQIDFDEALNRGKIIMLGNEADQAYAATVSSLSLGDYRDAKIIFTPLNGCAGTSFLPVLRRVGFKNIIEVQEQMAGDPDFSAVAKQIPNPEVPISLDLAINYARQNSADLVVAADPDADRIGVVSRKSFNNDEYVFLNGNQIGVLLLNYIIQELNNKNALPKNAVVIKTAVTTELLAQIARAHGIEVIGDLPVGFKYIADAMETRLAGRTFLFGTEESHGYLYGDYARDKDGAVAALLICEYASLLKRSGRTLFEQLEEIKKEYGYYRELLQSVFYPGMDGMDKMSAIMNALRANLPQEIAGLKVVEILDQLNKTVIDPATGKRAGEYVGFSDNALVFYLNKEKSIRVVARPSGTEPKIKFYAAVGKTVGKEKSEAEYLAIKKECDQLAYQIVDEMVKISDKISPGGEKFEVLG
ncbi:MAG: phospho-sugar mutase [Candidatus Magasanikbacteria bacterium]